MKLKDIDYDPETGNLVSPSGKVLPFVISHGYKVSLLDGRYQTHHRVAWFIMTGEWPENEIDHRNRKRADNRWSNLRAATKAENAQNRVAHSNNMLGVRGVRYRPSDRFFEPRIMVNGTAIYLGIYKTLDEAVEVRINAELEHFTHAIR
jgi:hypothetical protein